MRRSELLIAPGVFAVVGFGLVVWQSLRTIAGAPLGTLGAVLLYVGLGLFVIAAAVIATADRTERHDDAVVVAAPQQGTNGVAIAALIFAILFWPLGIFLGHIARHQIARTGQGGDGLAVAALVVAYVELLGLIVAMILLATLTSALG